MAVDIQETIELKIPSLLGLERIAIDAAASVAKIMGFTDDRINDLKTAVGEACINAIEHGNKQDVNVKVVVELIAAGNRLQIDVYDRGDKIPSDIQKPDINAKIARKQPKRGWGLFLIQSLMDEVKMEWNSKKGNVVRMVIHLKNDKMEGDNAT
jgi:serine/threonine-protein kinase RsbW